MGVLAISNDSEFVVLNKFQAHFKAVKKVDSFYGGNWLVIDFWTGLILIDFY